jgi:phosphoribosylanthranilate isomerase
VDFVGLWYAVPGGPADLPLDRWRELAARAAASDHLEPVLVTFSKDVDQLAAALEGASEPWVQLHGFQMPGMVRKLKEAVPGARVMKVLHIKGGKCVEERLIPGYEKAGVDVFLFDVMGEDGQVGSTGIELDPETVLPSLEHMTKPFLLAGGISAENRERFAELAAHPLFLGVDVDTNAREADRSISPDKVEAIAHTWKEPAHV